MQLKHSCGYQVFNSKVSAEYLAQRYLEYWRSDPTWKLKAFKAQVMRDLGVEVGYYKCWHARAKAKLMIYGDGAHQYKKVWDYVAAIRKYNPGSSAFVLVEEMIPRGITLFQRMYICLQGCKEGFMRGCRPIVGVDGCHLKGAYPGQCLVAVGKDGNNNIYPIAWAVVEVENADSWMWFLELLLRDLEAVEGGGLTFMLDRQKGLIDAFKAIAPKAEVRFCCRHIWANFKLYFPGQAFKDTFWNAARSSTKEEFEKHMEGIKLLSKDAYNYLAKIPPVHWSRHAFTTQSKSDMLLNNICESFNNVIREARDKPIITHMEWMRKYVMKRHCYKREGAQKFEGKLMPCVEKRLEWAAKEARNCIITPAGVSEFEVNHREDTLVVNLEKRTCSCYKWDLTGVPCTHALRCILHNRLKPEDFVDDVYSRENYLKAYGTILHPQPGPKHWETTPFPQPHPPPYRKLPGRPSKKKRRLEAGEREEHRFVQRSYKKNKCKKCGQFGHNTRTCKNAPAPPPEPKARGRPRSEAVQYSASVKGRGRPRKAVSKAGTSNHSGEREFMDVEFGAPTMSSQASATVQGNSSRQAANDACEG